MINAPRKKIYLTIDIFIKLRRYENNMDLINVK